MIVSNASDRSFDEMTDWCAHVYELNDCDFEDSWPRPGDPCTTPADEGCNYCTDHCERHKDVCAIHQPEVVVRRQRWSKTKAKYSGHCRVCATPIEIGEYVTHTDLNTWVHTVCPETK
jgi:hypothetical protein